MSLIITVDNGISANNEVAHAKALGLDCIITDHHTAQAKFPIAWLCCAIRALTTHIRIQAYAAPALR